MRGVHPSFPLPGEGGGVYLESCGWGYSAGCQEPHLMNCSIGVTDMILRHFPLANV